MKKYGYSERFIIKRMLGGENIKDIEYFSKKTNILNVKKSNLMHHNSRILLKFPLKWKDKNKVRLIILIVKIKKAKTIYPLFLDINHFAYVYSSSNFNQFPIPKNKTIFENEFCKKIFLLL